MDATTGIIGFLLILIFIFMAFNISGINKEIIKIRKFIDAYSKDTGIGISFVCGKCKKKFVSKQEMCPHCQAKTGL